MGEVLSFDRKSQIDKYVIKALKNIIKDTKRIRKNNYDEIEESLFELDYLEGYVSDIVIKVEQNGWKNKDTKINFIENYSYINQKYDHNSNFVFQELVLAFITDLFPKIVYNEPNYVSAVVNGIDNHIYEDKNIDCKKILNYLEILNKTSIKKLVLNDEEMYSDHNVFDIIDCIDQNYPIEKIISIFSEDNAIDNLDSGIITLDRIQKYCQFHTDLLFRIANENEDSDEHKLLGNYDSYKAVFDELYTLEHYSNKDKTMFIDMVINTINNNEETLIDKLKLLKAMTEVYLDYEEIIPKLD